MCKVWDALEVAALREAFSGASRTSSRIERVPWVVESNFSVRDVDTSKVTVCGSASVASAAPPPPRGYAPLPSSADSMLPVRYMGPQAIDDKPTGRRGRLFETMDSIFHVTAAVQHSTSQQNDGSTVTTVRSLLQALAMKPATLMKR
ncbi:uncharacterized protein LTR77_010513 [Saxophila tyrrhenica]|uniref:Uncharacterized protein n=1 Tax=Saxophila tyrrhenica TaxID=1690608 RepID=A0AAV9NYY9_9PEZI|nr:hypothetical protein LTR77_010513 [Saxophila tyrrhenica]